MFCLNDKTRKFANFSQHRTLNFFSLMADHHDYRAADSSACAALTTCAINGEPPSSCSTFARFDFILVPRPAAMIKTFRGLDDVLLLDILGSILDGDGGECLLCGS